MIKIEREDREYNTRSHLMSGGGGGGVCVCVCRGGGGGGGALQSVHEKQESQG